MAELTPKQEAFYVYELIDPRDGSVFYVGKGKGNRIRQHARNTRAGRIDNVEKYRRITSINGDGMQVIEKIVSWHETGDQALSAERVAISTIQAGLTNIIGGITTNAEANIERAKAALERTKPFDLWERTIHPKQRMAVEESMGSLRAFYDDHCAFLRGMAEVKI